MTNVDTAFTILREARAHIKELWELEPNGTTIEDLLYFTCIRLDECEEFMAQVQELAP